MQRTRTVLPRPGRRSLLGLSPRTEGTPRRPPWAADEVRFTSLCDRCARCTTACPAHLIARGSGGYPEISFRNGACSFCGRCAEACPTGALAHHSSAQKPWHVVARIERDCLALRQIECRVCGDNCEAHAIRFVLAPGRVAQPTVRAERCTGCGACASLCPAAAIRIEQDLTEDQSA